MANLPEEKFSQARNDWDIDRLLRHLGQATGKNYKRDTKLEVLFGALQENDAQSIAKEIGIERPTVNNYLSAWYEDIKELTRKKVSIKNLTSVLDNYRKKPPQDDVIDNLPANRPTFIGREKEMNSLLELLSLKQALHLIEVEGVGGVGKSALVLEAAYRCLEASRQKNPMLPNFEAIIWTSAKLERLTYNGIASCKSFAQHNLREIFKEIAQSLNRFDIINAPFEDQRKLMRHCLNEKRTLLIVDNLETVEDKEEVTSFLDHLYLGIKVVITSRERLRNQIRLDSLLLDDRIALIRNQASGLELTEEEEKTLAESTKGVPGAIVVSIGKLKDGERLETVLDRLKDAKGDFCRFCFEGSVQPLRGKESHKLLMALAMFREAPQIEAKNAIVSVAGLNQNLAAVDHGFAKLKRLSLVTEQGNQYKMPAFMREYALAELDAEIEFRNQARERWISWYQEFANKYGGEEWKEWYRNYDKLEAEGGNILAVLEWCASEDRYDDVKRLWERVEPYAHIYGYWEDRLFWSNWLLEAAQRHGDWATVMTQMRQKGWARIWKGSPTDLEEAADLFEKAWQLRDRVKDFLCEQELACFRAVLCIRQDRLEAAHQWINEAEKLLEQANWDEPQRTRQLILAVYYRAEIYYKRQDYEQAKELYEEVVKRGEEIEWQRAVNYAQNWLADIEIAQGNLAQKVETLLTTGWKQAELNKDKRRMGYYNRSLAMLSQKRGDDVKARIWADKAKEIFERLGMIPEAKEMSNLLSSLN
ncbi:NB-ARC domain-containing protein [Aerosakkonema sp. BLCC-F183]|uniref:NB-ARC domain-containing protein n=1 Tax=Aerosakkonema sp. BLCC-F183 TaxID=3342834 RepID=UPI0035BA1914